jgi:tetratricopeptide (TPR) repeat protein
MIGSDANIEDIESLTDILKGNPNSPSAVKAAKYYLENGDYRKAILLCEDSLNLFPEYLSGYLVLINSHISNSDYTSAHLTLQKANKIFPNHWAFKPLSKILEDYGYTNKYFSSDNSYDESASTTPKEVEIDEKDIETIVEESKTGSIVDSFDLDNFMNEAAIKEIDEPVGESFNNILSFPDEFLTINDFKPTETPAANNGEIIDSIINENDELDSFSKYPVTTGSVGNNPPEEGKAIKVFNDKFNLEKELSQLLGNKDLEKNLSEVPYEERINETQEIHTQPKLISRTLAEVYETQGKYAEAIKIYKTLLNNKEITLQECDSKIALLQNKISSDMII